VSETAGPKCIDATIAHAARAARAIAAISRPHALRVERIFRNSDLI
jgi:hypothetical protein